MLIRTSRSVQFGDDDGVAEDHEEPREEEEEYVHQAVVHLVIIVILVILVMKERIMKYDIDLLSSVNPDRGSRTWITELSDQ